MKSRYLACLLFLTGAGAAGTDQGTDPSGTGGSGAGGFGTGGSTGTGGGGTGGGVSNTGAHFPFPQNHKAQFCGNATNANSADVQTEYQKWKSTFLTTNGAK